MNKRTFIKTLGVGFGVLPFKGLAFEMENPQKNQKILPKPLQPGDLVGLISPAAATAERIEFTFAREALEALDLKVKEGRHLSSRRGHLAGTDEQRAQDLNAMFSDKRVKGVICIRGGSGAARILPMIDYENIRRNPKPLLGYSDITALHNAIYAQTGLITFHGPNGTGSWNSFNVSQFRKIFFEQSTEIIYENEVPETDDLVVKENRIQVIYPGSTQGELVGGNLTVLTALAGSPYLPDFQDKILFLEDIGEEPYRIDRMMSTLMLMGVFKKIKGFVFGQCTDCTPSGGYGNLTLDQLFDDYILPLKIPAYRGAMIGHIPQQFILPFGAKVRMDAEKGILELKEKIFQ
ncbi:MAG: LD-carboxypeptidase [Cyclobacteriaceae bacterium]